LAHRALCKVILWDQMAAMKLQHITLDFELPDNEMQIWSVRVRAYQMVQERFFSVNSHDEYNKVKKLPWVSLQSPPKKIFLEKSERDFLKTLNEHSIENGMCVWVMRWEGLAVACE
jgi:hypothetical protein